MSSEHFNLKLDERGLVPVVVQDAGTGAVLMLAWMNAEAIERTLESGEAHFWSRSRGELWHKGATSGNIQRVTSLTADCDRDALLLRVHPAGPACHTGSTSCFFQPILEEKNGGQPATSNPARDEGASGPAGAFDLKALFAIICDRRDHPSPGSYTAQLFSQGEDEIVKKVGEEAVEVILAAKSQGEERLVEELADLTYHALVLLAARGLRPEDVMAELARRHRR
jgi:phosphoribosyl-ATP pyrophosphohydrolase/phosphoribosyl-AMP cyclohydrolase